MHPTLRRSALFAALGLAVAPSLADAHVTLQPSTLPAGSFSRVDVRVPNERDDASTKKLVLKFPPGFISADYEPVPGWSAKVAMVKLAKPVVLEGERHTEQVDTITFSTRGKGIGPGQFQDFGLSLAMPARAGATLTFKAVQTYSDGQVMRWIGGGDAEEPAPHVSLTAAAPEPGAGASGSAGTTQDGAAPARAASGGDGAGSAISIAALGLGALGLLAGLVALARARRVRVA